MLEITPHETFRKSTTRIIDRNSSRHRGTMDEASRRPLIFNAACHTQVSHLKSALTSNQYPSHSLGLTFTLSFSSSLALSFKILLRIFPDALFGISFTNLTPPL